MATLTHHLVRRGMETLQTSTGRISFERVHEEIKFPTTAAVLVTFTVLFITFGVLTIEYTYGNLLATLASIEAPQETAIVTISPPEDEDHPDAPLISLEEKPASKQDVESAREEVLVISQRPVTRSFCALRRHFRTSMTTGAGRLSAFRGLHVFIINALLYNLASSFATVVAKPGTVLFMFIDAFVYTIFTNFQLAWNHIVISAPSSKSWFSRMPNRAVCRKAGAATLGYALIMRFCILAMMWFAQLVMENYHADAQTGEIQGTPFVLVAFFAFCAFIIMGVQIPAEIAITRVRASLLGEEEEAVVPFDRTFNGAVVPESEGGKGVLSLKEAIKGCGMETRRRVLGIYIKTMGMQVGCIIMGALAIVAELRLVLGPEWREILIRLAAQNVQKMFVA